MVYLKFPSVTCPSFYPALAQTALLFLDMRQPTLLPYACKKHSLALAGVSQLVGALSHKPEGHRFDSRSGHMPRLWVWSWSGCIWEAINWFFSLTSMVLSFSFSLLPSPISKNKWIILKAYNCNWITIKILKKKERKKEERKEDHRFLSQKMFLSAVFYQDELKYCWYLKFWERIKMRFDHWCLTVESWCLQGLGWGRGTEKKWCFCGKPGIHNSCVFSQVKLSGTVWQTAACSGAASRSLMWGGCWAVQWLPFVWPPTFQMKGSGDMSTG